MEVPRLGVESEIQMLVYTTATATQDPSCICELHHSSWQCRILNPLSEARGYWVLKPLGPQQELQIVTNLFTTNISQFERRLSFPYHTPTLL